jgi:hypothetical protein
LDLVADRVGVINLDNHVAGHGVNCGHGLFGLRIGEGLAVERQRLVHEGEGVLIGG